MPPDARSVGTLLRADPSLQALLERAREVEETADKVRNALPPQLGTHVRTVRINQKMVVIYADSPAWASRIRYLAGQIIRALRDKGVLVDGVKAAVLVPESPRRTRLKRHKPRRLSAENARLIQASAEAIRDPELKSAMLRLARPRGPKKRQTA